MPPQTALVTKLRAVDASDLDAAAAAHRFDRPVGGAGRAPGRDGRIRPRWRRRYTRWVVVLDLLAALGAAYLANRWRQVPLAVILSVPPVAVFAFTLGRTYEHRFLGHGSEEYRRLVGSGTVLLALTATTAAAVDSGVMRTLTLVAVPVAVAGSLLAHLLARWVLHDLRRSGLCHQRAVAIGSERSIAELVRTVRRDPTGGLKVVGACVSRADSERIEGVPVLGTPADVLGAMAEQAADTVVLTAWSDVSQEDLRRLSWDLEGTGVQIMVAPRLTEVAAPRMHVRNVGGMPLLTVEEPEFTGLRRVAKACLDYSGAAAGTVVLLPVFLLIGLAVRLSSPGPVLFRQRRIGKDGRPFSMHKFRSMYADAEERLSQVLELNESDGVMFKIREDPRITPVGRVIRRYSLDELPQLLDVLLGRMSLVGPRPPLEQEVARYEEDTRRRLLVKPGITGLWQVSGRSDLTWEETVRLDLSYVENWSFGLDLSIIFRTIRAVLAREGAY
ncbi:MAG: sugar transferase [Actinomycetales bacterium]|nr:sugar transferase [Actinomycetales bacterium]